MTSDRLWVRTHNGGELLRADRTTALRITTGDTEDDEGSA
jgi:hypothetical protein